MNIANRSAAWRAGLLLAGAVALSGCNVLTRLSEVGQAPKLTAIQNPVAEPNYQPVTMPMPAPIEAARQPSSLWRPGARAFLKDQRASTVGDLVTVIIDIDDKATIDNATTRTRDNSEDASADNLLGFEAELHKVLPDTIDPSSLIKAKSKSSSEGAGSVERQEQVTLKVAAVVTQVLPNGNLVLQGRQEMRVNFEMRELQVAGIIRPQDISSTNTIKFEQIAEARIAYGGRGQITDVQQPRYGQQIYDIIFPF